MTTITFRDLNKAAFVKLFGGSLKSINEKYPNNTFTFEVNKAVLWYERIGGWVPYNRYCKERQTLKGKARKASGLPKHFTGKKEYGMKLMDMAVFKKWKR